MLLNKSVSVEAVAPPKLMTIEVYNKIQSMSKFRQLLKYLGPSFIVSVAYIDPGNFATNISSGSFFNYTLIWVLLWSNLIAIFLQTMSAKLGIATGANLPDMCAKTFSRKANWFLYSIGILTAMATTMAEFLGGVLGLYLLFHIPLVYSGIITGCLTFFIAHMQKYGQRTVEVIISLLVAVICVSYSIELFLAKPDWAQVGLHTLMPSLPNGQAVLLAVGMLGATVMPHVIFFHSQLVQCRRVHEETKAQKLKHFRMEKLDITIAMNIAFIVNAAMVIVSASVFYTQGIAVDSIEQAHQSLTPLLGSLSSGVFGIALLASGLSSSTVSAMAGETIMDGFVGIKIPIALRRLITMAPGMAIICLGFNPMKALVLSQVTLSFALPFAIIPLLIIASRKEIMGALVNKTSVKILGWLIAIAIISFNVFLIYLTISGNM